MSFTHHNLVVGDDSTELLRAASFITSATGVVDLDERIAALICFLVMVINSLLVVGSYCGT